MKKSDTFEIVKELAFDEKKTVFETSGEAIYLLRPSQLAKRFRNYDVNKNFQIWLKEGQREFRPNHLRVMIDLNLRVRTRPDLKRQLLLAFDNIFYGNDPELELNELTKINYQHFLNDLIVVGTMAQLFAIEQEYCYHKESKFSPPTLFLQGWIRQFLDSPKEIDNLCMSICKGQPPVQKYVVLENRKSNKYRETLEPLWYLE